MPNLPLMRLLVVAGLALVSVPAFARDRVYLLKGNFVDLQNRELMKAFGEFRSYMASAHPDVEFGILHNSAGDKLCAKLKLEHAADPGWGSLILLGHSWGGQAAIDIGHCLQEEGIAVDLMVTIDLVQKWFHPSVGVIPAGVLREYNYCQRQDPVLKGNCEVTRADGSREGIENQKLEMPEASTAHGDIATLLIRNGTLVGHVEELLPAQRLPSIRPTNQ